MVDASTILKAAAVPMSHTATGVLKVEIMGAMLVAGVLLATFGFRRWYLMMYADWLLQVEKEELVEERLTLFEAIKDESLTEDQKWAMVDLKIPFNEEDYIPPLRSHFLNYFFIALGIGIAVGGFLTWLLIPA